MTIKLLKQKKSQRALSALARFLYRNTVAVLIVFAILTTVFGYLASRLEQKTTVRDLLPEDNLVVHQFEETVERFELVDRLVIVLQFDPENMDIAEAFAELFEEQIEAQPETERYFHWIKGALFDASEETDWFQYLEFLIRLMPPEHIPDFLERISEEGVQEQIQQNRRSLEASFGQKVFIEKDPLNLLQFAGSYVQEIIGNYNLSLTDGFLVNNENDMLLILGKPRQTPENVDLSVEMVNFIQAQIEATKQILREEEEVEPDELLSIGLTGPHPITAHENEVIRGDMINMFVTSFAFVIMLFILAYGRPLALFYVGLPLLMAEVWTLGVGYLLFGRLNLLTATFSAIIVGLGIDYAIHLFSRYLDERQNGHDAQGAMEIALSRTGLGTTIGGVTTACAFLAMGMGSFSGMREFGVIAATGILMCLIQMFVLLPCLLYMRERLGPKKRIHRAQREFQVTRIIAFSLRYKKIALAILLIGTVYLGWHAVQLRFNTELRDVRARSNPSINLQNMVTEKVGGSLRSLTFVLNANSEETLYQIHDALTPVLDQLQSEGELVRYDSLLSVFQQPDEQLENLARVEQTGPTGAELKQRFEQAMQQASFRMTDDSQKYIDHLAASLDATEPITLFNIYQRESRFVRPFLHLSDGRFSTVIHVYPKIGPWEKANRNVLINRILSASPQDETAEIFVTGTQTISDEIKKLVRDSFKVSTFIAIGLVFLILYIHFRQASLMLLTLIPLLAAVTWMLGTMHLLGIDITIINFVATPLIIGIGIDDGVHIVEKYLHRGDSMDLVTLMAGCGKAVTLTSITTILGFSSLFLAEYSGFRSLGLCSILGVFFCWLGSVVLLPLLMDGIGLKFVRDVTHICKDQNP